MQLERERAEQRALQQRLEQHAAAEQRAAARAEMEALRAAEDQARSLDQEELGADPTLLCRTWRGLRKVFDLNFPSLWLRGGRGSEALSCEELSCDAVSCWWLPCCG